MNRETFNSLLNKVLGGKGLSRIPSWWLKKTFGNTADYLESYAYTTATKAASNKQDKSVFVTVSDTNTDITLQPNTFTKLDGVRSALHILLQKPSDGTTPVYNCTFMLGDASEDNFTIDSYFEYDVLWARKDAIVPYNEYGLYVHGNMAWLVMNPMYIIEAVYDVKRVNSNTMLYNTESDKGGSSAANSDSNVIMLVDGATTKYESTYRFTTKGEHTVHYCFKYFPDMTRRFDDCSDIKSIKLFFIGEKDAGCFGAFYGNALSSFEIPNPDTKLNVTNASLMFSGCYKLTDDMLNPALKKMSGNNPEMVGMLDGCNLLDTVDLSTWNCNGGGVLGNDGHLNQILFKGAYSDYLWGAVNADDNGELHPITYFEDRGYVKKVNIEAGELPYKDLTFYSEDRIIASYTKEEALALTELPAEPKHSDEFSFNGWTHTLDEIKTNIETFGYCNVIARYTILSNYHTLTVGNKDVIISFIKDTALENGGVRIEWGDGTEELITATETCSITHSYADYTDHVIKIYPNGETIYDITYLGEEVKAFPDSIYISSRDDNGAPVSYTGYFAENESVSINLTFWLDSTSQGNFSTLGMDVDWGDGTTGGAYVEFGTDSYSLNHTYSSSGEYTITLSGHSHSAAYCHGGAAIECSADIQANVLKDIKYAEGITSINGLANVIPSTVTNINCTSNMNTAVATIIPESVTNINGEISAKKLEAIVFDGNPTCVLKNCPILTFVDVTDKNITLDVNMNSLRYVPVDPSATELPLYTGYYNLRKLDIPDNITSIKDSQFSGCYKLRNIVLPETTTSIGSNAFAQCSITDINIPGGVSELNGTFSGARHLEQVTLNEGLTTIGPNTFYNTSVKNIELPNTVVTIGNNAFEASSLQSITIPESVTSIGDYAFKGCNYISNLTIADGVTSMGIGALSSMGDLGEVSLSSNLTAIPDQLCENCTALTSFIVPKSVATIGTNFIKGCPITTLSVDENNPYLDSRENCNGILETETNTLICAIKNTVIPETCVIIGNDVFKNTDITSITIPDSVIEIGNNAFYNLYTLFTVNGCNNVKKIGDGAFYYTNISSFNFENVEEIGANAFYSTDLKSISLPNIKKIGSSAFYSCSQLTSIDTSSIKTWCDVEKSGISVKYNLSVNGQLITDLVIPDDVVNIKNNAFYNCKIASLSIPGNTIIGNYAFYACTDLTTVSISGNVGTIGSYAFNGCKSLTTISMSEGVAGISERTFDNCDALETIILPNAITTIPSYSISYCDNLKSVTFGSGLQKIENYALAGCSNLTDITCYAVIAPELGQYALNGISGTGTLNIPFGSDYSTWSAKLPNWTIKEMYTPTECTSLTISADDVNGRSTTTTIHYTAVTNGTDTLGNTQTNITVTGDATSAEFEQNTSETDTVERTITFEYLGQTASTTITQGVWVNQDYTVDLNNEWQLSSSIANPDNVAYDGVYESFSNYNVNNGVATMYIDITGYENFKLYIRSNAESTYDYVMVSQLDQTITGSSSYSDTALVKAHTRGSQQSGTDISNYTPVEFTGIDGGEHRITIVYRKDGSSNSGTDRGYILIPKS